MGRIQFPGKKESVHTQNASKLKIEKKELAI